MPEIGYLHNKISILGLLWAFFSSGQKIKRALGALKLKFYYANGQFSADFT